MLVNFVYLCNSQMIISSPNVLTNDSGHHQGSTVWCSVVSGCDITISLVNVTSAPTYVCTLVYKLIVYGLCK